MINYKKFWIIYVCCCLFFAVGVPDFEWLIAIEEEPINIEMPTNVSVDTEADAAVQH